MYKKHPKPICTKIGFVLIYEATTIAYNNFGQRLGTYYAEEGLEQKYLCTFYTPENVYISLKQKQTLVFNFDFTERSVVPYNTTEVFFDASIYTHVESDSVYEIHYHFHEFMQSYYCWIDKLNDFPKDTQLEEKYHSEMFLDLYANLKIVGLVHWKKELVDRLMNRIKQEIAKDIFYHTKASNFPTVNDSIFDELMQLEIVKKVQLFKEMVGHKLCNL